jgi:hypothetical protein
MIPAPEVKAVCPQCGLELIHFANVDRCPNHGQIGIKHQGDTCPNKCGAPVVTIPGAGRRCQQCGGQW